MEKEYWNPSVKAKKEIPLTKEEIEQLEKMGILFEGIHCHLNSIITYGNKLQLIKDEFKKKGKTPSTNQ